MSKSEKIKYKKNLTLKEKPPFCLIFKIIFGPPHTPLIKCHCLFTSTSRLIGGIKWPIIFVVVDKIYTKVVSF